MKATLRGTLRASIVVNTDGINNSDRRFLIEMAELLLHLHTEVSRAKVALLRPLRSFIQVSAARKRAVKRYRSELVIAAVAGTCASIVVGSHEMQSKACELRLLHALIEHIHLSTNMRTLSNLMVAVEVILADHPTAVEQFVKAGGSEAVFETIARVRLLRKLTTR